jgi:hypothetical protein
VASSRAKARAISGFLLQCRQTCRHHDVEKMGHMFRRPVCLMIWATPVGFLKAAQVNHASSRSSADGDTVTFTLPNRHRMQGFIDAAHHVTRVRTWIEQSIVGDMLVETDFSDYRAP